MNIYLFSENVFFCAGIKSMVESEHGVSVKLVTIKFLMENHNNVTISDNDVFIVSLDDFNVTMSILVMLDNLLDCNFLVHYNNDGLRNLKGVNIFSYSDVGDGYIRKLVQCRSELLTPKLWGLTSRESIIISHRLAGLSVFNIGSLLKMNIKTVYTHQRNALKKMQVKTIGHFHMLRAESKLVAERRSHVL